MMITSSDLIQTGIFIVALLNLCDQIFSGKRKQPPLLAIVTAARQGKPLFEDMSCSGFPFCIIIIKYLTVVCKDKQTFLLFFY